MVVSKVTVVLLLPSSTKAKIGFKHLSASDCHQRRWEGGRSCLVVLSGLGIRIQAGKNAGELRKGNA